MASTRSSCFPSISVKCKLPISRSLQNINIVRRYRSVRVPIQNDYFCSPVLDIYITTVAYLFLGLKFIYNRVRYTSITYRNDFGITPFVVNIFVAYFDVFACFIAIFVIVLHFFFFRNYHSAKLMPNIARHSPLNPTFLNSHSHDEPYLLLYHRILTVVQGLSRMTDSLYCRQLDQLYLIIDGTKLFVRTGHLPRPRWTF